MYMKPGSVMHGTLRQEDICEMLLDLLQVYGPDNVNLIQDLVDFDIFQDQETKDEVIINAFDLLDEYCPPFHYFGSHEGDGSDFGVWPSLEQVVHAVECGEAVKLSDLADFQPEIHNGYKWIVIVNDHGNMSVYPVVVSIGPVAVELV